VAKNNASSKPQINFEIDARMTSSSIELWQSVQGFVLFFATHFFAGYCLSVFPLHSPLLAI
jgi:hypothetical protein